PALPLALLLHRAPLRDLAASTSTLAAGVVVYLLPQWLVTVAEHPSWSVRPSLVQAQHVATFVILGCGPALLLSLGPLRSLWRSVLKRTEPEPLTWALIAMGGSLLFALLFQEDRFAALRHATIYQPNLWWGPSACAVLLFPLLLRAAIERISAAGKADWMLVSAFILFPLQVISGALFALAYPAIIHRAYPQESFESLEVARQKTPPTTRFLIDPVLNLKLDEQFVFGFSDLAGVLARPCLFRTDYMAAADRANLDAWELLFKDPFESVDAGWVEYDAAILSQASTRAQQELRDRHWTSEELPHGFQLWRRHSPPQP
ncbi:MAG: hypothetical protein KF861_21940, partial [Planctomycetaceae bacterium]|nr:hypothetical protein [Planctomycetaceae bacterium]